MNATLVARHDLTGSVARFRIRPHAGVPAFEPGQYLALGVLVGDRLRQRPYSTASPRDARSELEFLVRLVPCGALTPRLWAVPIGGRLRMGRPKGLFTLREDDRRAHLFVATGTGLAPFLSMVETSRSRRPAPRIVVLHGVSRLTELAYRDRFERLSAEPGGLSYVPLVSRPDDPVNGGWTGRTGRVPAALDDIWDAERFDPTTTVAYLCGNPEMITAAGQVLRRRGLLPEAILSEQYWPS